MYIQIYFHKIIFIFDFEIKQSNSLISLITIVKQYLLRTLDRRNRVKLIWDYLIKDRINIHPITFPLLSYNNFTR